MTANDGLPDVASWRALSVDEIARAFDAVRAPWRIAGGWAIDLFLGEQTRAHGDIDVAMLRDDVGALRALQPEFDLHIAHDGAFTRWDGGALEPARHQFWVRRRDDDAWAFEVLFEQHAAGSWVFRRDARIRVPLTKFGCATSDGVPYIAPEVALLYKAQHAGIARHAADFARAAPVLAPDARAWLRDALETAHPGHAWIAMLGELPG
jgi:hypothetical protein